MRKKIIILLMLISAPLLAKENQNDIELWSKGVREKAKQGIPGMVLIKDVKPTSFVFVTDPFNTTSVNKSGDQLLVENIGRQVQSDKNKFRRKDPLENFPIESLMLIGVVKNHGESYGLVRDVFGFTHTVKVGSYIGKMNGKIIGIESERLVIKEHYGSNELGDGGENKYMNIVETIEQIRGG